MLGGGRVCIGWKMDQICTELLLSYTDSATRSYHHLLFPLESPEDHSIRRHPLSELDLPQDVLSDLSFRCPKIC